MSDSKKKLTLRLGIDVGGTNTDVVAREESLVLDEKFNILESSKSQTTKDITSGIITATKQVLRKIYDRYNSSHEIFISSVCIGTTHFVNCIKQRSKELSKVSVIRLCSNASLTHPPFIDIPNDLRKVIEGPSFCVSGGYNVDGKELSNFNEFLKDEKKILSIVEKIKSSNVKCIVISGIFSPTINKQEIEMKNVLLKYLKDYSGVNITLSHEIAGLGLLERENASILNGSLNNIAKQTINSFKVAMKQLGIESAIYLTKNDGTICDINHVLKYPIHTFASGPTNSMKGGSLLIDKKLKSNSVIIIDIGGTTTDAGLLINGIPQLSNSTIKLGDIRTNYCMPNVVSIALGGGTIVNIDEINNIVTVGPKSVGYELDKKSKCFGGKVLTVTDISYFKGWIKKLGNKELKNDFIVNNKKLHKFYDIASEIILSKLRGLIDHIRLDNKNINLVLCGGGALLIPKTFKCDGIDNIIIPNYCSVANAIGATTNQISGNIEKIISLENKNRENEIEKLHNLAINNCIKNGCVKDTIKIANQEEIPLQYVPGKQSKFLIKAIGSMDLNKHLKNSKKWVINDINILNTNKNNNSTMDDIKIDEISNTSQNEFKLNNILDYKRTFNKDKSIWTLSILDIEYLSIGCGVLGCGGGGDPYYMTINLKEAIRNGKKINIITNPKIINDNQNVLSVAYMGAPSILQEKLMNNNEITNVIKEMKDYLNIKAINNENISLIAGEIGGLNGLTPLMCGNLLDLNIIDGDFMGRAFPELQMTVPSIYGKNLWPITLSDDNNNKFILKSAENNKDAENKMRMECVKLGMKAAISVLPLKGKDINENNQRVYIPNVYNLAWNIGKIIYNSKLQNKYPLFQLTKLIKNSQIIFYGKVSDIERRNNSGFSSGLITLTKLNIPNNKNILSNKNIIKSNINKIFIDLQNENLTVKTERNNINSIIVSVPDLIVLFDNSFNSIPTENVKFGLHCYVMVFPAHSLLTTKEALKVIGPKAFGYEIEFKSINDLMKN